MSCIGLHDDYKHNGLLICYDKAKTNYACANPHPIKQIICNRKRRKLSLNKTDIFFKIKTDFRVLANVGVDFQNKLSCRTIIIIM